MGATEATEAVCSLVLLLRLHPKGTEKTQNNFRREDTRRIMKYTMWEV